jgi:uncharacterized membrane protein YczE
MEKKVLASELALAMGVMCNAIAVSLMIKSELGVSTISSVPVVLNEMFAHVTIGSWNFLFQVVLVVVMALITRKFLGYVFSIALALLFGYLLDFFELLFSGIVANIPLRIVFFFTGFFMLSLGISLMLNCRLPALPFDLFVREMSEHFGLTVKQMKTGFDVVLRRIERGIFIAVPGRNRRSRARDRVRHALHRYGDATFREPIERRFVFQKMMTIKERA